MLNLKEAAKKLNKEIGEVYWRKDKFFAVGEAAHNDPNVEDFLVVYCENMKMRRHIKQNIVGNDGCYEEWPVKLRVTGKASAQCAR